MLTVSSYSWSDCVNETTTTTTTILWPFVRATRVSRYQKKHSRTHLSRWSAFVYQLSPSTMIHSILPVQFTCLAVFLHNLCPSPLWSTSWSGAPPTSHSMHFFTQSVSSFRNTCPYRCNLFCYSTKIMSSIPSLSLSSLLRTLSFTLTSHIHLIILISARWSAIS